MPRPKSDIDKRILSAAKTLFLGQGVDGTSLREIADAASTNIGMVYYYFPTKDDVFFALVDETYSKLLADLERRMSVDGEGGVEAKLQHLFSRIGEANADEVDVIHLIVREALGSAERRKRLMERFMKGHIPLVLRHLVQGQSSGALNAKLNPIVMLMATFALAGPPQIIRKRVKGPVPMALAPAGADLSKQLLDVLLHGILREN
jgi:AcrR family transcriptional regulator